MISSFGNRLAEDLFNGENTKATKAFPPELRRAAQRKLQYLNSAKNLADLKVPPGNRLEALKGQLRGYFSIRVNDQWRIIFRWEHSGIYDVKVIDYH